MQPKYFLVAIISAVSALPSEKLHIWQPPNPTDRQSAPARIPEGFKI